MKVFLDECIDWRLARIYVSSVDVCVIGIAGGSSMVRARDGKLVDLRVSRQ